MAVFAEQSIVLDGVAEAANLVYEVVRLIVHEVECLGDLTVFSFVVVELDRAWVDIAVSPFPSFDLVFERLELRAGE